MQNFITRCAFEEQQKALSSLPADSKMSISYDCWISPSSQSFMVLTGHFIDKDFALREVLLYFKCLDGTETTSWKANALIQTLTGHGIQDRIFALTVDTTLSNKETFMLLDAISHTSLSSDIEILRTPYLTSIVKRCLNRILKRIKALPPDEIKHCTLIRRKSAIARGHFHDISHTLNKLRYLQIHTIECHERAETFKNFQKDINGEKLLLISDVKTLWNLTFLMLRRAKRLREFIAPFCAHYGYEKLLLDDEDWFQIDYLLCVMEPFVQVMHNLTRGGYASIQSVLYYYQNLLESLAGSMKQL
ncbi:uncharacterized protein N7483_005769 [Penicillium malachiteum]|uniref:uncharacterized protein n=1 Tax=Penicillium malachiteum TaxID=1324776 RepID=UPI0025465E10|nr:uncharacterized protein N7483_005769 [Penicillium malachiteum]KAJ5731261.1 hypothetical protein N7483_005769 [Penicillium malachiteum]